MFLGPFLEVVSARLLKFFRKPLCIPSDDEQAGWAINLFGFLFPQVRTVMLSNSW